MSKISQNTKLSVTSSQRDTTVTFDLIFLRPPSFSTNCRLHRCQRRGQTICSAAERGGRTNFPEAFVFKERCMCTLGTLENVKYCISEYFNGFNLSLQLVKSLVPTDPLDPSNILLEVVSGRTTGGISCLIYSLLVAHKDCFLHTQLLFFRWHLPAVH